jgi:signal peptidase I
MRIERRSWIGLTLLFGLPLLVLLPGNLGAAGHAYLKAYRVAGSSSAPAHPDGDRVLVNGAAYDLRLPFTELVLLAHAEPERGDVVVYRLPDSEEAWLKRVVGLPGERMETPQGPVVVPDGYYFVVGDNRANSFDSRHHGPVARERILGRVSPALSRLF